VRVSRDAVSKGRIVAMPLPQSAENGGVDERAAVPRIQIRDREFLFWRQGNVLIGVPGGAVVGKHAEEAFGFSFHHDFRCGRDSGKGWGWG
jgi:hypothetical protein